MSISTAPNEGGDLEGELVPAQADEGVQRCKVPSSDGVVRAVDGLIETQKATG